MPRRPRPSRVLAAVLAGLAALGVAACGGGASADADGRPTLRLGYFPNLTHAPAIVGVETGIFEDELGDHRLVTSTFSAGPSAVEALFSGAVDAVYLGPNPAINAFVKSKGEAIRIVAGATSGGASLVVRPGITEPADLRGKKLATPQLGGSQDVALRSWLKGKGIKTTTEGGGAASVLPQENAQTLETFRAGEIDGAWVPEPWATRLVDEGGGRVLVDEADLWPGGEFVTTHLVVRKQFLEEHPDTVRRLLRGQVAANAFLAANEAEAQKIVNDGIERITSKRLAEPVITAAWKNLRFTNDPIASSLSTSARHARDVGLLEDHDLDGIYALGLLAEVLEETGQDPVSDT